MEAVIAWKPVVNDWEMASARLRCFLPSKYLNEAGWSCEMFNERNAAHYDLVVFQKVYDEGSIKLARDLTKKGVKTVFDLCDNHFYNPNSDPWIDERAERLRRIIDSVNAVTVSTPELKKLIPEKDPVVIDDAIDWPQKSFMLNLYARLKKNRKGRTQNMLRIVWYGNAGSENPRFGLIDLPRILPSLEKLNARLPLTFTIISNSWEAAEKYVRDVPFRVKYHDWKRSTFSYLFSQQDVCVIPVSVNPFTVCKTNNRLVLSLLQGIPVVADRIPSYDEFGDFVLFNDWENNLYTYATDTDLRLRHLSEGSKYIMSKYNKERVVRQWSSFFEKLLG